MRLVTWNVNHRVDDGLTAQAAALAEMQPDIVALQEASRATDAPWKQALADLGLPFVVSALDLAPERQPDGQPFPPHVLLATRWPLLPLPSVEFRVPQPERIVAAVVSTPGGEIEVHVAHVPSGLRMRQLGLPLVKAQTFEGIWQRLARSSTVPRILCGDFNAPKAECADGTIIPWGPPGWTADAELAVLRGLAAYDLLDVYRAVNGPDAQAISWHGPTQGFRFDHVFAARSLKPVSCDYVDAHRLHGLSDHAPMCVQFNWR